MFDTEKAIAAWREQLAQTGNLLETDLDELESHLRDQLDALEEVELTGEEGFRIALEQLGEAGVLGAEFAKVNLLLAWRAPLCAIATGALVFWLATPLIAAATRLFVGGVAALHFPLPLSRIAIWLFTLGLPFVVLAKLLGYVGRSTDSGLRAPRSATGRVVFVTACAVLVLAGSVGRYWIVWQPWSYAAGAEAMFRAANVLRFAIPFGLGAYVVGLRAAGASPGTGRDGSSLWAVLGYLAALTSRNVVETLREASYAAAGGALETMQVRWLVWILAIVTPVSMLAAGYAWLRTKPSHPAEGFARRTFDVVIAALCIAPIINHFVQRLAVVHYTVKPNVWPVMMSGNIESVQADLFVASFLAVATGALILRMGSTLARTGRTA